MKKMFLVVLVLIVSATTYVKAQNNYRAYLNNPGSANSVSQYKSALNNLFFGDASQWHPNARMYYERLFAIQYPGESIEDIVRGTEFDSVEGQNLASVARINIATGEQSYFPRKGRVGEYKGRYKNKAWTYTGCGNHPKPIPGSSMLAGGNGQEIDDYGTQGSVALGGNTNNNTVTAAGSNGQPIIINNIIPQAPAQQVIAAAEPKIIYRDYDDDDDQPRRSKRKRIVEDDYYEETSYRNNNPQTVFVANQPSWLNRMSANLTANVISDGIDRGLDALLGTNKQDIYITSNNSSLNSSGKFYTGGWKGNGNSGGGGTVIKKPRQDGNKLFPNNSYGNNSNLSGLTGGNIATDRGGTIQVDRTLAW